MARNGAGQTAAVSRRRLSPTRKTSRTGKPDVSSRSSNSKHDTSAALKRGRQKPKGKSLFGDKRLYHTLMKDFEGILYVCSPDYRIEYVNDQFVARSGYEGVGQKCYKVLHGFNAACPWCAHERIFKGETVCWEVHSPEDNSWNYVINMPFRHKDGSLSKLSLVMDMSAGKRLEEQLKQREEEFRTLAENSPDIIARFDAGLRLLYVNRDPMKSGEEQAIGKTWRERGFPEEKTAFWEMVLRRVIASGKAETHEHSIASPTIAKGIYFSSRIIPEFNAGGKVRSVLVITSDVTAQKRSREELERHKEYYKTLADNSPVAIVRLDRDLRFSYCSPSIQKIAGKPPEHYLGNTVLEAIKVFDAGRVHELGMKAITEDEPATEEFAYGEGMGKRFFKVSFVPEHGESGHVVSVLCCIRDITDTRKVEQVLKRDKDTLERLVHEGSKELLKAQIQIDRSRRLSDIGVLASTIAHEVRNPLAAIKTAAYNIGRKASDARFERQLGTINKKVLECDLIIQNLLNYSRVKEPVHEPVRLALLLNECMENILAKYASWNVGFVKRLHFGDEVTISADPTQLKILFSNLLDNAFQSLVEKLGQVSLEATAEHGRVLVDIRDTGAGIDKNDLPKIFDPFFTRKSKGTGLGLTISKQIVELHDGSLVMTSVRDAGTSVRVTLPLRDK